MFEHICAWSLFWQPSSCHWHWFPCSQGQLICFLCVLCCSGPHCSFTTYCVELNTQQNLLLSKWALLLCSTILLSCALCWHSVCIFLILEESTKVGKVFESRHCKKDIGKTTAGRVSTLFLLNCWNLRIICRKGKYLGLPQWLHHWSLEKLCEYAGKSIDSYDEEVPEALYFFPVMCFFLQVFKGTAQAPMHAPPLQVVCALPQGGQLLFELGDLFLL